MPRMEVDVIRSTYNGVIMTRDNIEPLSEDIKLTFQSQQRSKLTQMKIGL